MIIGIDPGVQYTGWGIIKSKEPEFVAGNYIQTKTSQPLEDRLYTIYSQLTEIIDLYSPDVCAIEKIFINNNPKSSIILSETRGALLLTVKIKKLNIFQYETNKIKRSVTGNGHANKEQIRYMVGMILKCDTKYAKHDLCDALATAICCANHIQNSSQYFDI